MIARCASCASCPGRKVLPGSERTARPMVALLGNPNTGKSTLFNALSGLRQRTGNWPGKTVTSAVGSFTHEGRTWQVVDLPGVHSLEGGSPDEEVARDFVLEGDPDVVVVLVDATALERGLPLALQALPAARRVLVATNFMDEARRLSISIDLDRLAAELGVPVLPMAARSREGIDDLEAAIDCSSSAPERSQRSPPPTLSALHERASTIARSVVTGERRERAHVRALDLLLTSRRYGFPVMLLAFAALLWITIAGANAPSSWIASVLLGRVHPVLHDIAGLLGLPAWLVGITVDGAYLTTAWVVAVMLPPMAIFFPLFTLLEDAGFLPRFAFNLDALFRRAGAHGKMALTMAMGFGCNAAGVIAARIIDSPRERLIAILTNTFALCNGRWPTQFLIAAIFIGGSIPAPWSGVVAALSVVATAFLGVMLTFAASLVLSRTLLRGKPSLFALELPPYRRPAVGQVLYTSVFDRTLPVLRRAVLCAAPAGVLLWTLSNLDVGGRSVTAHTIDWLDPVGVCVGLNGILLVAYLFAVPANEIVIPTILVLTILSRGVPGSPAAPGVLFEAGSVEATRQILAAGGITLAVAVRLMVFSLAHNPCATTIYTIWKETRSVRWTLLSVFLPLAIGLGLTASLAALERWFAW